MWLPSAFMLTSTGKPRLCASRHSAACLAHEALRLATFSNREGCRTGALGGPMDMAFRVHSKMVPRTLGNASSPGEASPLPSGGPDAAAQAPSGTRRIVMHHRDHRAAILCSHALISSSAGCGGSSAKDSAMGSVHGSRNTRRPLSTRECVARLNRSAKMVSRLTSAVRGTWVASIDSSRVRLERDGSSRLAERSRMP
eukprot:scaffold160856_cov30-Tisochrysis_lutea.AAC.2